MSNWPMAHWDSPSASGEVLDEVEREQDDVEVAEEPEEVDLAELEKSSEDAPVVRLVNAVIMRSPEGSSVRAVMAARICRLTE